MISAYENIDFGEKGIAKGIYYGQNERVDELNNRIQTRYFPDVALPPNFDPRPLSTKFCLYPIYIRNSDGSSTKKSISINGKGSVEINKDETNQTVVYNPGTDRGPPITFLKNIDIENQLRKEYIPSTNSNLYKSQLAQPTNSKGLTNQSLTNTIPNSNAPSQTYNLPSPATANWSSATLHSEESLNTYIPNYLANPYTNDSSHKIGSNILNNFTKTQLRDFS